MPKFKSYRAKIVTQVFLAALMLLFGCGIYLLFRSKSLYIYKWCAALGLSDNINTLRYAISGWNMPDFVKYSLPDGMYCAAYILIMDAIWYKEKGIMKYLVIFLVPVITVISEVLQYFGIVRGTFDYRDLVCYAIPLFTYLYYKNRNKFIKTKKEMKKYFYTMLSLALFAVGFAASDEEESASSSNEQRQKQAKVEKKEEKKSNIPGTYEVTDKVGCTIRITLKEDETATITGVRGENVTYYCTWIDQSYYKNRMALIEFSDLNKIPYLVFDGGTGKYSSTCFLSKDGWFYWDVLPETNNPEWRLPAKKIK